MQEVPHNGGEVLWTWCENAHDTIFRPYHRLMLKRVVIWLSLLSFVTHIVLIFLARLLHAPAGWAEALGPDYLAAIATPFNVILFYEVMTLIGALPNSTTKSIASQYEIVSLIFLREVLRDISHIEEFITTRHFSMETLPLFLNMWGSVLMYLMVAIFRHVAAQRAGRSVAQLPTWETIRLIRQKKAVSSLLAVLLTGMAAWNIGLFGRTFIRILATGQGRLESATSFYNDMFTVMVFTDVLVLILLLLFTGRYEMVFRNAGYVVSIVVIRFALTEGFPYGAPLALMAMLFGTATVMIYNYHVSVSGPLEG
jgi:hypothetical protein